MIKVNTDLSMENPYDVLKITSVKMFYNKQTNKNRKKKKKMKKNVKTLKWC